MICLLAHYRLYNMAGRDQHPRSTSVDQFSLNKEDRESSPCAQDSSGLADVSIEDMLLHQKTSWVAWVFSDVLPSSSYNNGSTVEDCLPSLKANQNPGESLNRCSYRDDGERNGCVKKESSKSCGASVPKLMEYFGRHADEFAHLCYSEKNVSWLHFLIVPSVTCWLWFPWTLDT